MSRYLLVDSGRTLESGRGALGEPLPEDLTVVATTSAGMLACEHARTAYVTIDSFSPRKDIVDLGWRNYRELDAFCERWDRIAQDSAPCLRARGIRPFRFGYYDFKILLDSVSVKILLLKNLFDRVGYAEVFFMPEAERDIGSGEVLWPRETANLFSILLEAFFGRSECLKRLPIDEAADADLIGAIRRGAYDLVRTARDWARRAVRRVNGANGRTFLLFHVGHDIEYVLPRLRARGFQPLRLSQSVADAADDVRQECRKAWANLSGEAAFRTFFSLDRFDYFPLVESALRGYLELTLPAAVAAYDQMREPLAKHGPAFALTGTINLGLVQRCRMRAAQAYGLPLLTYTEGAGYGSIISPIYDHTEICDGDAMLCYGEGNVEYYRDLGRPTKRLVPVGSAHQEVVRKNRTSHRSSGGIRSIMYVGTVIADNVMHLPNCGLISTAYFTTQLKLFRMLASLPQHIQAVVKPNPSDPVSKHALRLPELRRIRLESRRFERVLEGIDLFIIDYPSTVLLSAISTDAYVFVLVEEGVAGLTPKQQERLEKRAYIFEHFEHLAEAVHRIVADIADYPPRMCADYMTAYSIHKGQGDAADRAVTALEQLSAR